MVTFSNEEKEERGRLMKRMLAAWTLAEVREASASLRAWMTAHPADTAILEGGEMLSHASDYAELRDAERKSLGFSEEVGQERERVFVQAERALSVGEIATARKQILLWRWNYPCDERTVEDLLRHLDRQEIIAHFLADAETECEPTAESHEGEDTVYSGVISSKLPL